MVRHWAKNVTYYFNKPSNATSYFSQFIDDKTKVLKG